MGDIHHMHQQIGLTNLIEGALKGLHKICRQLSDKAYGIGQQKRKIAYNHLAHRRIKRGKEFVLRKDFGFGQQIDEGGFSHIGITHQRDTDKTAAVLALRGFLTVDIRKTLFEQRHAVQNDAAVHFELCFARSAQTHTALSATAS